MGVGTEAPDREVDDRVEELLDPLIDTVRTRDDVVELLNPVCEGAGPQAPGPL